MNERSEYLQRCSAFEVAGPVDPAKTCDQDEMGCEGFSGVAYEVASEKAAESGERQIGSSNGHPCKYGNSDF